jgi:hypothetical protein
MAKNQEREELQRLAEMFPRARRQFEMEVEATCLEVTNIAQQISSAIGEVSIDEAKDAIIREFTERLKGERAYSEFTGKKK